MVIWIETGILVDKCIIHKEQPYYSFKDHCWVSNETVLGPDDCETIESFFGLKLKRKGWITQVVIDEKGIDVVKTVDVPLEPPGGINHIPPQIDRLAAIEQKVEALSTTLEEFMGRYEA